MATQELSEATQDYLREIHKLQARDGRARTTAIAEAMSVPPSSASGMVKKLAAAGLVEHTPYRGVRLTEDGAQVALEVIRHHRLLERYLAETLELSIDEVHAEADLLEHALSEQLEARIDASLGHPRHDPHGDPIPDVDLSLGDDELRPLSMLTEGEEAVIRRVPDRDPGLLRYLMTIGLVPGQRIILQALAPFGGPLTLACNGSELAISRELAAEIGVA